MDFREYTVARDGNEVVIQGTIREPVHWDFTIRMCEDDLPGLAKVAASKHTIGFLLRSVFKRKKDSHWSVSREEHLESVKAALAQAKEKADTKTDAASQARSKGPVGAAGKTTVGRSATPAGTSPGKPERKPFGSSGASPNGAKPAGGSPESGKGTRDLAPAKTVSFGRNKESGATSTSAPAADAAPSVTKASGVSTDSRARTNGSSTKEKADTAVAVKVGGRNAS